VARELCHATGIGWDEPTGLAEREPYFGEVIPSLMRENARDRRFKPRFDALVVDEIGSHHELG